MYPEWRLQPVSDPQRASQAFSQFSEWRLQPVSHPTAGAGPVRTHGRVILLALLVALLLALLLAPALPARAENLGPGGGTRDRRRPGFRPVPAVGDRVA